MVTIKKVQQYYETSGLEIPQPIQELIGEITKLSPCEQEGYRKEIERLKEKVEWLLFRYSEYRACDYETKNGKDLKKIICFEMQQALKDKS